jgi:hypothetical protein
MPLKPTASFHAVFVQQTASSLVNIVSDISGNYKKIVASAEESAAVSL